MGWKTILVSFVLFFIILSLIIWLFFPYDVNYFETGKVTNFSLSEKSIENSQFYPSMRFSYKEISYRIDPDCSLQKKNDMERGFKILENLTILKFYPIANEEEIFVHCSERVKKTDDRFFIAGEGGPTSSTIGSNFTLILHGEVLLIRDMQCDFPNVPIHELLHVLGFSHSENENNLMYPTTHCGQEIGQDTIDLINQLYSVPSNPDIFFLNSSALLHGRYLDLNLTLANGGLVSSNSFIIKVFFDSKQVKEINVEPIKVGYNRIITIRNIGVNAISTNTIRLIAENSFDELDKGNNEIILYLKN